MLGPQHATPMIQRMLSYLISTPPWSPTCPGRASILQNRGKGPSISDDLTVPGGELGDSWDKANKRSWRVSSSLPPKGRSKHNVTHMAQCSKLLFYSLRVKECTTHLMGGDDHTRPRWFRCRHLEISKGLSAWRSIPVTRVTPRID